ncbi:threonine/serine exporter family protein, partial [Streptomyces sp. TRM76130]|nr:threonine/serine exporter family protein [Streptomyces sp. TRM76130]
AVPRTGPSESEVTSEFALPRGLDVPQAASAESYSASAFTPPAGLPAVNLAKDVPWQDRMRTMLRMPVAERPAPEAH